MIISYQHQTIAFDQPTSLEDLIKFVMFIPLEEREEWKITPQEQNAQCLPYSFCTTDTIKEYKKLFNPANTENNDTQPS